MNRSKALDPAETLSALETLTRTHSGSQNAAGVEKIQAWVEKRLKLLGFETSSFQNLTHPGGRLLVGEFKGESPEFIDFVFHSDTVQSGSEAMSPFQISFDGKIATGPGVMDDKGGILVALNGIADFLQSLGTRKPELSLRVISAPSEELGSPGFHEKFAELSLRSKLILGFEPALGEGDLIEARRGNRWYRVETTGREEHSGRGFRHGVNAAHDLVKKLAQVVELTDLSKEITVSIGHILAGRDAYNVIAGKALAKVDTRFSSFQDRDQVDGKLREIFSKFPETAISDGLEAKTKITVEDDCPPFTPETETQNLIEIYLRILKEVEGKEFKAERSGGGADCCYMSRPGLMIIDGLGPIGGKMHSDDEYLIVESLFTRARALSNFLTQVMKTLK